MAVNNAYKNFINNNFMKHVRDLCFFLFWLLLSFFAHCKKEKSNKEKQRHNYIYMAI